MRFSIKYLRGKFYFCNLGVFDQNSEGLYLAEYAQGQVNLEQLANLIAHDAVEHTEKQKVRTYVPFTEELKAIGGFLACRPEQAKLGVKHDINTILEYGFMNREPFFKQLNQRNKQVNIPDPIPDAYTVTKMMQKTLDYLDQEISKSDLHRISYNLRRVIYTGYKTKIRQYGEHEAPAVFETLSETLRICILPNFIDSIEDELNNTCTITYEPDNYILNSRNWHNPKLYYL